MTKARLAPGADRAGYVVFKLGGAGALLGLAVGLVVGGGPALESWLTYSLSVALAGAVLGSLAWVGQATKTANARQMPTPLPQTSTATATVAAPAAEQLPRMDRPRVSAFRAGPKAAR